MPLKLGALSILALSLSAGVCGPAAPGTSPDLSPSGTDPVPLDGTQWVLLRLRGEEPLPGAEITLDVSAETVGGYSGCNWYGGGADAEGGRFSVGDIEATARACAETGLMDQEREYLELLTEASSYEVRGDTLRLANAAGQTLLTFLGRPPE
jgi:heat shock protein HslJ